MPASAWWALAGVLVIWGLSLAVVWRYGVDVPAGDQWHGAKVFQDFSDGRFTFQTLIQQHNEARPAWPRVIWLTMLAIAPWNTRAEMFVMQAALIVTSLGLYVLWRRSFAAGTAHLLWMGATLILFSLAQFDNLLWGFQSVAYFPAVSLVLALVLIGARAPRWPLVVALCCVLGSMATFSFANGLLFWPLLLAGIAATSGVRWRTRLMALLVVSVWAAFNGWLYFHDYVKPVAEHNLLRAWQHPEEFLQAFLVYTGASLSVEPRRFYTALLAGAAINGILIAALVILSRYRHDADLRARALPWTLMAGYGVVSGLLAAYGRLTFGTEYLLASRYVAMSSVGLIGVLGLASLAAECVWTRGDERRRWRVVGALSAAATLAACCYVFNALDSLIQIDWHHENRLRAQATLRFLDAAEDQEVKLYLNWGGPETVRERAPILQAKGILVPKPVNVRWIAPRGGVGRMEQLAKDAAGVWHARGWMWFFDQNRVPDAVLITDERASPRRVIRIQATPTMRPDLSGISPRRGWETTFTSTDDVPRLGFWVFDVRTGTAYALCVSHGACGAFEGAINGLLPAGLTR
jgi:hypothetical protein